MDILTCTLLLIIAVVYYAKRRSNPVYDLPGPFSLPLLGTWLDINKAHLMLEKWAKEFGAIFRISILTQPVVVVNTYDMAHEALVKRGSDFSGRPKLYRAELVELDKGIGFSSFSAHYKQKRKVTIQGLKFVGAGKMRMENVIMENLEDFVSLLAEKAKTGDSLLLKQTTTKYFMKVLLGVIFGEDVSLDDPVLDSLCMFNLYSIQAMSLGKEELDIFPELRFIDPNYFYLKKVAKKREAILVPLYYKLKSRFKPSGVNHCLMSRWQEAVDEGILTDADCIAIFYDMIVAGVISSNTLTQVTMALLADNQELQRNLQEEIDNTLEKGSLPTLDDLTYMPYAHAFVLELLRHQSPLPLAIPHMTIRDTELGGHKLAKNTWVFINHWSITRDESVYEQPNKFMPERFLDEAGQIIPHTDQRRRQNIAFGLGDRRCPAEGLAKNRLFLTIVALAQKFNFDKTPESPTPDVDTRKRPAKIIFEFEDYPITVRER